MDWSEHLSPADQEDGEDDWEGLLLGTNTCLSFRTGNSNRSSDIGIGIGGQYNINDQLSVGGLVNLPAVSVRILSS